MLVPSKPMSRSRISLGQLQVALATLIYLTANLFLGNIHACAESLADKPARPNIVLILADDKYAEAG